MGQTFDMSAILAEFEKRGVSLNEEQTAALEAMREADFRESAEKSIGERLSTEDEKIRVKSAEKWTAELFNLANRLTGDFKSAQKNRGRGEVIVTFVAIETPAGLLKCEVSQPVKK